MRNVTWTNENRWAVAKYTWKSAVIFTFENSVRNVYFEKNRPRPLRLRRKRTTGPFLGQRGTSKTRGPTDRRNRRKSRRNNNRSSTLNNEWKVQRKRGRRNHSCGRIFSVEHRDAWETKIKRNIAKIVWRMSSDLWWTLGVFVRLHYSNRRNERLFVFLVKGGYRVLKKSISLVYFTYALNSNTIWYYTLRQRKKFFVGPHDYPWGKGGPGKEWLHTVEDVLSDVRTFSKHLWRVLHRIKLPALTKKVPRRVVTRVPSKSRPTESPLRVLDLLMVLCFHTPIRVV